MDFAINQEVINWLLEGDPSIKWQTLRNLCSVPESEIEKERSKIESEGWGKRLLSFQDPSGTWNNGLYTPKWTSTTYTLLLLRRLGIKPNEKCRKGCQLLLDNGLYKDGGINLWKTKKVSETCVTGMVFGILSYFQFDDERLEKIFQYLVENQMSDGGWNCQYPYGATHASFHTTLLVLEALYEYSKFTTLKKDQIEKMQQDAHEFLLKHRLFRSHRTGKVVDSKMLRLSFPPRWRYNILTSLDYFQAVNHPYDERLTDAIEIIRKKEKNSKWTLQEKHQGKTWFEMERAGTPSRWNTLRALRVLKWWEKF